ncbi:heme peroxidase [Balamuthia mandrillaris]
MSLRSTTTRRSCAVSRVAAPSFSRTSLASRYGNGYLGSTTVSSSSRRAFATAGARASTNTFNRRNFAVAGAVGGAVLLGLGYSTTTQVNAAEASSSAKRSASADWAAIRKEIIAILDDPNYDDGSYGPVLVRLAWHASGTYSRHDGTGGSNGAKMRFPPESAHGANAGLHIARQRLEAIKQRHPEISYADLWTLAGAVAIEHMGGPKINWRPGRTDESDGKNCTPDGRLPDASQGQQHVRDIFYRMGFNDREIVALIGAHALGRCHTDRSGYKGPWTKAPTMFSNEYFRELLDNKWTKKKWNGPEQYEDPTGELMMLPADLALIKDPEFKKYVQMYAEDEELFFKDFAAAFQKLEELGVKFPEQQPAQKEGTSWWSKIFG